MRSIVCSVLITLYAVTASAQTWPPRVQEIADALAGLHPTWVSDDTGPRLALNTMIAQQVCFELGAQWGMKRADPTRPISSDIVAFTGPPFVGYDWETAHNGTVGRFPPPIDLSGQTFVPVACMNHLNAGNPQPVPQPIPQPTPQPQPPPSQPPVVIVQPSQPPLDLSGIDRQLASIESKLDGHIESTEAFQAQARGVWKSTIGPALEFTAKWILPPAIAFFTGKKVAQ